MIHAGGVARKSVTRRLLRNIACNRDSHKTLTGDGEFPNFSCLVETPKFLRGRVYFFLSIIPPPPCVTSVPGVTQGALRDVAFAVR